MESVAYLGKKEKLIKKLKSRPKDMSFAEAVTLLRYLGYVMDDSGRTSGSAVTFERADGDSIFMHKPHPRKELKMYQVDILMKKLETEGLI